MQSKLFSILGSIVFLLIFLNRLTDEKLGTFSAPVVEIKRTDVHRLFFHVPLNATWTSKLLSQG